MANEEHLAILRQGVEVWNRWRESNPGIDPMLSGASLFGVNLNNANLREASFSEARIFNSQLRRANLFKANLCKAKLRSVDLSEAELCHVNLRGADLRGVTLFKANLSGADFLKADLSSANLNGAFLNHADLNEADLSRAGLRNTKLFGAKMRNTTLAATNLNQAVGLESVVHDGPSSIGIDTIFMSQGKIPDSFLRGAGVPEDFIRYLPSFFAQPFQFYSCFISHSSLDKLFCERLYADLQANRVRVWYFPEDAKWGRTVWGEIDRGIKVYDKLVVVCSMRSLMSGPVLREIERALNREDREGKHVLFPIRLDDYIFEGWNHERKADVLSKVVGDFTNWQDPVSYKKAFDKLLAALQAEDKKDPGGRG